MKKENHHKLELSFIAVLCFFVFSGMSLGKKETDTKVWVSTPSYEKSCESVHEKQMEISRKKLESAKIQIFGQKLTPSGKPFIQMCGAETGSRLEYLIQRQDAVQAEKLGFKVGLSEGS